MSRIFPILERLYTREATNVTGKDFGDRAPLPRIVVDFDLWGSKRGKKTRRPKWVLKSNAGENKIRHWSFHESRFYDFFFQVNSWV